MTQKQLEKIYHSLPMNEEMLNMLDEFKKKYSNHRDIENVFKILYYQGITDIEFNILEVGQTVYYVFGKYLQKGIIEEILPYSINYTTDRIKIQGKNKYFSSKMCVKVL